ncbi:hypothetical protein EPN44_09420 [bacterium]|nr:MAG: hypothetical protein EPN44_09420 [bacterium]
MKRIGIVLSFIAAAATVASGPAWAGVWHPLTQKNISVTITVTPSPVAYVPRTVAQAVRNPAPQPGLLAHLNPAALSAYHMVAQAGPTQGNVPVTINVQLDPTAQYLHIVGNTTVLNAGYGSNIYPCAYTVYADSPYLWRVEDWVYGSANGASIPFPTYAYPTQGDLGWLAEGITTSFAPFANAGGPGEMAWKGAANVAQSVCVDLQLTVPSTISAGTYSASLTYSLEFYY